MNKTTVPDYMKQDDAEVSLAIHNYLIENNKQSLSDKEAASFGIQRETTPTSTPPSGAKISGITNTATTTAVEDKNEAPTWDTPSLVLGKSKLYYNPVTNQITGNPVDTVPLFKDTEGQLSITDNGNPAIYDAFDKAVYDDSLKLGGSFNVGTIKPGDRLYLDVTKNELTSTPSDNTVGLYFSNYEADVDTYMKESGKTSGTGSYSVNPASLPDDFIPYSSWIYGDNNGKFVENKKPLIATKGLIEVLKYEPEESPLDTNKGTGFTSEGISSENSRVFQSFMKPIWKNDFYTYIKDVASGEVKFTGSGLWKSISSFFHDIGKAGGMIEIPGLMSTDKKETDWDYVWYDDSTPATPKDTLFKSATVTDGKVNSEVRAIEINKSTSINAMFMLNWIQEGVQGYTGRTLIRYINSEKRVERMINAPERLLPLLILPGINGLIGTYLALPLLGVSKKERSENLEMLRSFSASAPSVKDHNTAIAFIDKSVDRQNKIREEFFRTTDLDKRNALIQEMTSIYKGQDYARTFLRWYSPSELTSWGFYNQPERFQNFLEAKAKLELNLNRTLNHEEKQSLINNYAHPLYELLYSIGYDPLTYLSFLGAGNIVKLFSSVLSKTKFAKPFISAITGLSKLGKTEKIIDIMSDVGKLDDPVLKAAKILESAPEASKLTGVVSRLNKNFNKLLTFASEASGVSAADLADLIGLARSAVASPLGVDDMKKFTKLAKQIDSRLSMSASSTEWARVQEELAKDVHLLENVGHFGEDAVFDTINQVVYKGEIAMKQAINPTTGKPIFLPNGKPKFIPKTFVAPVGHSLAIDDLYSRAFMHIIFAPVIYPVKGALKILKPTTAKIINKAINAKTFLWWDAPYATVRAWFRAGHSSLVRSIGTMAYTLVQNAFGEMSDDLKPDDYLSAALAHIDNIWNNVLSGSMHGLDSDISSSETGVASIDDLKRYLTSLYKNTRDTINGKSVRNRSKEVSAHILTVLLRSFGVLDTEGSQGTGAKLRGLKSILELVPQTMEKDANELFLKRHNILDELLDPTLLQEFNLFKARYMSSKHNFAMTYRKLIKQFFNERTSLLVSSTRVGLLSPLAKLKLKDNLFAHTVGNVINLWDKINELWVDATLARRPQWLIFNMIETLFRAYFSYGNPAGFSMYFKTPMSTILDSFKRVGLPFEDLQAIISDSSDELITEDILKKGITGSVRDVARLSYREAKKKYLSLKGSHALGMLSYLYIPILTLSKFIKSSNQIFENVTRLRFNYMLFTENTKKVNLEFFTRRVDDFIENLPKEGLSEKDIKWYKDFWSRILHSGQFDPVLIRRLANVEDNIYGQFIGSLFAPAGADFVLNFTKFGNFGSGKEMFSTFIRQISEFILQQEEKGTFTDIVKVDKLSKIIEDIAKIENDIASIDSANAELKVTIKRIDSYIKDIKKKQDTSIIIPELAYDRKTKTWTVLSKNNKGIQIGDIQRFSSKTEAKTALDSIVSSNEETQGILLGELETLEINKETLTSQLTSTSSLKRTLKSKVKLKVKLEEPENRYDYISTEVPITPDKRKEINETIINNSFNHMIYTVTFQGLLESNPALDESLLSIIDPTGQIAVLKHMAELSGTERSEILSSQLEEAIAVSGDKGKTGDSIDTWDNIPDDLHHQIEMQVGEQESPSHALVLLKRQQELAGTAQVTNPTTGLPEFSPVQLEKLDEASNEEVLQEVKKIEVEDVAWSVRNSSMAQASKDAKVLEAQLEAELAELDALNNELKVMQDGAEKTAKSSEFIQKQALYSSRFKSYTNLKSALEAQRVALAPTKEFYLYGNPLAPKWSGRGLSSQWDMWRKWNHMLAVNSSKPAQILADAITQFKRTGIFPEIPFVYYFNEALSNSGITLRWKDGKIIGYELFGHSFEDELSLSTFKKIYKIDEIEEEAKKSNSTVQDIFPYLVITSNPFGTGFSFKKIITNADEYYKLSADRQAANLIDAGIIESHKPLPPTLADYIEENPDFKFKSNFEQRKALLREVRYPTVNKKLVKDKTTKKVIGEEFTETPLHLAMLYVIKGYATKADATVANLEDFYEAILKYQRYNQVFDVEAMKQLTREEFLYEISKMIGIRYMGDKISKSPSLTAKALVDVLDSMSSSMSAYGITYADVWDSIRYLYHESASLTPAGYGRAYTRISENTLPNAISRLMSITATFTGADATTVIHEFTHNTMYFMRGLIEAGKVGSESIEAMTKDLSVLEKWAISTAKKNGRIASKASSLFSELSAEEQEVVDELISRAFERYLKDNYIPTRFIEKIFSSFKKGLLKIYNVLTGYEWSVPISDNVKAVFAKMMHDDTFEKLMNTSPTYTSRADLHYGILNELYSSIDTLYERTDNEAQRRFRQLDAIYNVVLNSDRKSLREFKDFYNEYRSLVHTPLAEQLPDHLVRVDAAINNMKLSSKRIKNKVFDMMQEKLNESVAVTDEDLARSQAKLRVKTEIKPKIIEEEPEATVTYKYASLLYMPESSDPDAAGKMRFVVLDEARNLALRMGENPDDPMVMRSYEAIIRNTLSSVLTLLSSPSLNTTDPNMTAAKIIEDVLNIGFSSSITPVDNEVFHPNMVSIIRRYNGDKSTPTRPFAERIPLAVFGETKNFLLPEDMYNFAAVVEHAKRMEYAILNQEIFVAMNNKVDQQLTELDNLIQNRPIGTEDSLIKWQEETGIIVFNKKRHITSLTRERRDRIRRELFDNLNNKLEESPTKTLEIDGKTYTYISDETALGVTPLTVIRDELRTNPESARFVRIQTSSELLNNQDVAIIAKDYAPNRKRGWLSVEAYGVKNIRTGWARPSEAGSSVPTLIGEIVLPPTKKAEIENKKLLAKYLDEYAEADAEEERLKAELTRTREQIRGFISGDSVTRDKQIELENLKTKSLELDNRLNSLKNSPEYQEYSAQVAVDKRLQFYIDAPAEYEKLKRRRDDANATLNGLIELSKSEDTENINAELSSKIAEAKSSVSNFDNIIKRIDEYRIRRQLKATPKQVKMLSVISATENKAMEVRIKYHTMKAEVNELIKEDISKLKRTLDEIKKSLRIVRTKKTKLYKSAIRADMISGDRVVTVEYVTQRVSRWQVASIGGDDIYEEFYNVEELITELETKAEINPEIAKLEDQIGKLTRTLGNTTRKLKSTGELDKITKLNTEMEATKKQIADLKIQLKEEKQKVPELSLLEKLKLENLKTRKVELEKMKLRANDLLSRTSPVAVTEVKLKQEGGSAMYNLSSDSRIEVDDNGWVIHNQNNYYNWRKGIVYNPRYVRVPTDEEMLEINAEMEQYNMDYKGGGAIVKFKRPTGVILEDGTKEEADFMIVVDVLLPDRNATVPAIMRQENKFMPRGSGWIEVPENDVQMIQFTNDTIGEYSSPRLYRSLNNKTQEITPAELSKLAARDVLVNTSAPEFIYEVVKSGQINDKNFMSRIFELRKLWKDKFLHDNPNASHFAVAKHLQDNEIEIYTKMFARLRDEELYPEVGDILFPSQLRELLSRRYDILRKMTTTWVTYRTENADDILKGVKKVIDEEPDVPPRGIEDYDDLVSLNKSAKDLYQFARNVDAVKLAKLSTDVLSSEEEILSLFKRVDAYINGDGSLQDAADELIDSMKNKTNHPNLILLFTYFSKVKLSNATIPMFEGLKPAQERIALLASLVTQEWNRMKNLNKLNKGKLDTNVESFGRSWFYTRISEIIGSLHSSLDTQEMRAEQLQGLLKFRTRKLSSLKPTDSEYKPVQQEIDKINKQILAEDFIKGGRSFDSIEEATAYLDETFGESFREFLENNQILTNIKAAKEKLVKPLQEELVELSKRISNNEKLSEEEIKLMDKYLIKIEYGTKIYGEDIADELRKLKLKSKQNPEGIPYSKVMGSILRWQKLSQQEADVLDSIENPTLLTDPVALLSIEDPVKRGAFWSRMSGSHVVDTKGVPIAVKMRDFTMGNEVMVFTPLSNKESKMKLSYLSIRTPLVLKSTPSDLVRYLTSSENDEFVALGEEMEDYVHSSKFKTFTTEQKQIRFLEEKGYDGIIIDSDTPTYLVFNRKSIISKDNPFPEAERNRMRSIIRYQPNDSDEPIDNSILEDVGDKIEDEIPPVGFKGTKVISNADSSLTVDEEIEYIWDSFLKTKRIGEYSLRDLLLPSVDMEILDTYNPVIIINALKTKLAEINQNANVNIIEAMTALLNEVELAYDYLKAVKEGKYVMPMFFEDGSDLSNYTSNFVSARLFKAEYLQETLTALKQMRDHFLKVVNNDYLNELNKIPKHIREYIKIKAEEAANDRTNLLFAAMRGGEYDGVTMIDSVGESLRTMIDYASSTKADDFIKIFIPFWRYPSRSLPFWASTMWRHPHLLTMYLRYIQYSENEARTRGYVNSKGEPLPSLAGYMPIPGTDIWFNPTAPLIYRYVYPELTVQSQQEDTEDMDITEKAINWIVAQASSRGISVGPIWSFLFKNRINDPYGRGDLGYEFGKIMLPIPPELIPPFLDRAVIGKVEQIFDPQSDGVFIPQIKWKDLLIEREVLWEVMRKMDNTDDVYEKRKLAEEAARVISNPDRESESLWITARNKFDTSTYAQRVTQYFTGFYFKSVDPRYAELLRVRDELNLLKKSINNDTLSSIFNLDISAEDRNVRFNATQRSEMYRNMKYDDPMGMLYNIYQKMNFVVDPATGTAVYGKERRQIMADNFAEDEVSRKYYDGINQIDDDRDFKLSHLSIPPSSQELEVIWQEWSDRRAEIEAQPMYALARRPWSSGSASYEMIENHFLDVFWYTVRETRPVWNKQGNESYAEFQDRVSAWEKMLPIIAKKAMVVVDVTLNNELSRGQITDGTLSGLSSTGYDYESLMKRIEEQATIDGYNQWHKNKEGIYDALNNAWWEVYAKDYDTIYEATGATREIAKREFEKKHPTPPSFEELWSWIVVNYPNRFEKTDAWEKFAGREVFSIQEQQSFGEYKAEEKNDIWDILNVASLVPDGMKKLRAALNEQGVSDDHITTWYDTGGDPAAWSNETKFLQFHDALVAAAKEIQLPEPSDEMLAERVKAESLNELFKELAKEQLGDNINEIVNTSNALAYASKKDWLVRNPSYASLISQYYNLKDSFAAQYQIWAKYFWTKEYWGTDGSGQAVQGTTTPYVSGYSSYSRINTRSGNNKAMVALNNRKTNPQYFVGMAGRSNREGGIKRP